MGHTPIIPEKKKKESCPTISCSIFFFSRTHHPFWYPLEQPKKTNGEAACGNTRAYEKRKKYLSFVAGACKCVKMDRKWHHKTRKSCEYYRRCPLYLMYDRVPRFSPCTPRPRPLLLPCSGTSSLTVCTPYGALIGKQRTRNPRQAFVFEAHPPGWANGSDATITLPTPPPPHHHQHHHYHHHHDRHRYPFQPRVFGENATRARIRPGFVRMLGSTV